MPPVLQTYFRVFRTVQRLRDAGARCRV